MPPELARRLERYAHQTLSLADDFVHLARAESGRFLVETFNLSDSVLDAVDDLWPLADAKKIRILSEVPDEEALVTGDRALITRKVETVPLLTFNGAPIIDIDATIPYEEELSLATAAVDQALAAA